MSTRLIRLKSAAFNLLFAAFCFGWPILLAAGSQMFGIFVGLFLWPLGAFYLWSALTLKSDNSLRPKPPSPGPVRYEIPAPSAQAAPDNFCTLLSVAEQREAQWPRSTQLRFARLGAAALGSRVFDGTVPSPEYSTAMEAYFAQLSDPVRLIQITRDYEYLDLWSRSRIEAAPDVCELYRAQHHRKGAATAGFAIIEPKSRSDEGVIYEIGVPKNDRKMGMGARILDACEDLLWERGDRWALLSPRGTDSDGPSHEALRRWYLSRGYEQHPTQQHLLRKRLL